MGYGILFAWPTRSIEPATRAGSNAMHACMPWMCGDRSIEPLSLILLLLLLLLDAAVASLYQLLLLLLLLPLPKKMLASRSFSPPRVCAPRSTFISHLGERRRRAAGTAGRR